MQKKQSVTDRRTDRRTDGPTDTVTYRSRARDKNNTGNLLDRSHGALNLLFFFLPAAEKMEEKEANDLMNLLGIQEDDDGLIKYMGKNKLSWSFNEWKELKYYYIFLWI